MSTWAALQEYARAKYELTEDKDNSFSLVFQFADTRRQLITVRAFKAFQEDWIEFSSVVCKEEEMDPKIALRKNAEFVMGALALQEDGHYILTYTLPMNTLILGDFERPLRSLSRIADLLERDFTRQDKF